MRSADLTGKRFGRWLVQCRVASPHGRPGAFYQCLCDCGTARVVVGYSMTYGDSTSCGCYLREMVGKMFTKHGKTNSPEWKTWAAMIARCTQPSMETYQFYGGKGISVCERWKEFANFLADMGSKPKGLSLDRIDSAGNYEPGNCKWSTAAEQAINKSNNIWVEIDGRKQVMTHWAKELGIKRTTVIMRIKRGWDPVRALTEPV